MIGLLLLQLTGGLLPHLSPGRVQPFVTTARVCAKPYLADDSARIGNALWQTVLTRYGLAWSDRAKYQATTVVPTALGGVVVAENLAPTPVASEWNRARKVQVEHKVYAELCVGHLHLSEAQHKAGVGWVMAWRTYFAP